MICIDKTFTKTGWLTEALDNLKAATKAERDALETAATNEAVETKLGKDVDDSETSELKAALAGATTDATKAVDDALVFSKTDFIAASNAVRAVVIAEEKSENAKLVAQTKAAADKVGAVDKLEKANSAAQKYTNAMNATEKASAQAEAEFAKFEKLNAAKLSGETIDDIYTEVGGKVTVVDAFKKLEGIDALIARIQAAYNADAAEGSAKTALEAALKEVLKAENTASEYAAALEGKAATETLITVTGAKTGDIVKVKVGNNAELSFTVGATQTADAVAAGLAGVLAPQLGAANVSVDKGVIKIKGIAKEAVKVTDTADTDLAATDNAVLPTETISEYYDVIADNVVTLDLDNALLDLTAPKSAAYAAALEQQKAFNEAVAEYSELASLNQAVKIESDALKAATDWFADNDYELPVTLTNDAAGTAESDIFVLADADVQISGFGAAGDDLIFVGNGFKVTNIADDADLTKAIGNASLLEVFVQQTSTGTVLAFEKEAFSGSASGTTDLIEISLVGIAAENLVFGADGFITLA